MTPPSGHGDNPAQTNPCHAGAKFNQGLHPQRHDLTCLFLRDTLSANS